jgi:L-aminopeptidase/D-esterase-like protein
LSLKDAPPGMWDMRTGSGAALPAGFLVGHAQDEDAGTGCTALVCEQAALAAVSVRGAAPATRETDLLDPRRSVERINAVMLTGGSAFGLDAAAGAMRWCAERRQGFGVGEAVVPLVCGASLFDLSVGDGTAYPDADFGYRACADACAAVTVGNVGAGTGASVGKLLGMHLAMKCGFGATSICLDGLVVTALVALNAVGTVYDRSTGRLLAGVRDPGDERSVLGIPQTLQALSRQGQAQPSPATNTTIGCILTNSALTKAQAAHVADMAHDGYARALEPVHTGLDGDTVFVLSTTTVTTGPFDLTGALSAAAMEAAVHNAALSAQAAYGLPSAHDLDSD